LKRFVLDVSTAAKWVLPGSQEPLREEANELLHGYRKGEVDFLVPDLFWSELGNVLWKSVRTNRVAKADAERALREIHLVGLKTVATQEVIETAFAIACATDRAFYDSVYVALAVDKGVSVLTADERLVNALGSRWPVRWLGTFTLERD
jgi:predicted nucleic acid-binding protein